MSALTGVLGGKRSPEARVVVGQFAPPRGMTVGTWGGQPEERLARAFRSTRIMDFPMKLSRTVSYAVRATLQLAQLSSKGPVPCSKLAAEGKMPERFLLQILRNLVTHGILRSTRGVDGGYALVRPADQISLLEVIEAKIGRAHV